MCGIVGVFRPGGEVCSDQQLAHMRDRMVHRGPDGGALWRSETGNAALGHRRLSIIDLSNAAAQPMANADGSVVLVFNGEIYNHGDLRRELSALGRYSWRTDHSDTEVLLHAYEEWGLSCLDRLYGMFAIAILDRRSPHGPVLHLIRDRMGVKPLYFARSPAGEWVFASEIRAILAHPHLSREMEPAALWHYLTFIVAPAPLTMFKGIFKLPAGHVITIGPDGEASATSWYKPPLAMPLDLTLDQATEQLTGLLRASIRRRMVSDVPFGVLLSGGVDSSLNVALMSEMMDRPVTSFSIGYQGHDDFNEFDYARRIAKRYGTDHHERLIGRDEVLNFLPDLVDWQEEPIADNVCIPLFFLSELVKSSGTTVVQVGEGADEHFLGYWWCEHYRRKYDEVYAPARAGGAIPWWRRLLGRTAMARLPQLEEDAEFVRRARADEPMFWGGAACFWGDNKARLAPQVGRFAGGDGCPVPGLMPQALPGLDCAGVVAAHLTDLPQGSEADILRQISFIESRMRLPEHLLMRVDKMTMAHSIEARVPFLDHDVVEFASRLPLAYKLHDGLGKRIVKKTAEPFMDDDMIYRRKQGFGAPMDRWFAEPDFNRRCRAAIDRSALVGQGWLDGGELRSMLAQMAEGRGGRGFHLWTALNAILWYEVWIEGRKDCI